MAIFIIELKEIACERSLKGFIYKTFFKNTMSIER